jgi:hypothetical protein
MAPADAIIARSTVCGSGFFAVQHTGVLNAGTPSGSNRSPVVFFDHVLDCHGLGLADLGGILGASGITSSWLVLDQTCLIAGPDAD